MNASTFKAHLSDPNLPAYCRELDADCPIDRWISYAVKTLRENGIETYESCQGGSGHAYPEPAVRFYGTNADGYRAAGVALTFGLPVRTLRRFWIMERGELTGPHWEMTFDLAPLKRLQREVEKSGRIS